jgi:sucrose-6-phosphate hydrolase SacC (GH32 family)
MPGSATPMLLLAQLPLVALLLCPAAAAAAAAAAAPLPVLRGLEHRPVYHLIPQGAEAGWLSDPNGPIYHKGRFHMFYQAATTAQMRSHCSATSCSFHTPDPVSWGHMSSVDLVSWKQHPLAITPAAPTSYEGADVYSGAMIEDPSDGSVKAFYACGCGDAKPPGGHNDAVCYASSSDDNLTTWTKYDGPHGSVVLYIPAALGAERSKYLPEAGSQFIFRNATDGSWLMMVGSGVTDGSRQMATLLFSAPDLKPTTNWTFRGPQFVGGGAHSGAWCPFFVRLDPLGDPSSVAMDFQNWVGRGSLKPPDYKFVPAVPTAAAASAAAAKGGGEGGGGSGSSVGTSGDWPLLDAGMAHVSAVFVGEEPKGRENIVMRWLTGAPSCVDIPGSTHAQTSTASSSEDVGTNTIADAAAAAADAKCDPRRSRAASVDWGWVGVHSLPITITKAVAGTVQNDQSLAYRVVEEVETLRVPGSYRLSYHRHRAQTGGEERTQTALQWHSAARGAAVELSINITLPASPSSSPSCYAGLVVRATEDGTEQTTILLRYDATVATEADGADGADGAGGAEGGGVVLAVNRSLSSLSGNQTKTPLVHVLPRAMLGRADNTLRVFVDKSVLEVYVGEHTILSARVYPVAGDKANLVGTIVSSAAAAAAAADGEGQGQEGGASGCALGPLESWQMRDVYA